MILWGSARALMLHCLPSSCCSKLAPNHGTSQGASLREGQEPIMGQKQWDSVSSQRVFLHSFLILFPKSAGLSELPSLTGQKLEKLKMAWDAQALNFLLRHSLQTQGPQYFLGPVLASQVASLRPHHPHPHLITEQRSLALSF